MKDRFRFRAWDKQDKELIYEAENTYDCQSYNGHTIWHDNFACLLDDEERYVVEQCTGLKDKNGKLIYEGDIVKFYEHNYEVYFNENTSAMDIWNEKKELGYSLYYHEELEVIGNIHENPDLLKGE